MVIVLLNICHRHLLASHCFCCIEQLSSRRRKVL